MDTAKKLKRVVPRPLWPYLGAVRRFVRAVPLRTSLQKKRLLSDPSLTETERALLAKVSSRIYPGDGMYHGDATHYFKVGLSAIQCIDEALARTNSAEVQRILDFPCGSGRVLRFLRQRFPAAEITACELEPGPVEFCVRTFGALPAFSSLNLDEVSLEQRFDLIWCGSLATHLNGRGILSLLRLFHRQLRTGGLMIFTTHGDFVPGRILRRDFDYGLTPEQINRIGASYPETGYGFEDYPGEKDYGVSLTSPDWIRSRVAEVGGLREVYFKERGWDDHQDVFGFVRQ
ncbi:MAG TPA: class I SAM-dependent methyltransferase [Pyrinomonadaceae bacterium]|jgi:SAM-dependent methyltransferase|nr:class I SAM-dependent methyltransferase [Pyrinomonadaceae bacterium]